MILLLKTDLSMQTIVRDEILAAHSYACPAVLSLKVDHINAAYSNWLMKQLA